MSVLDMFASALGAFIIIAVILFPYYNQAQKLREKEAEAERTVSQVARTADAVRRAQETSRSQREEIRKGRVALAATPQCQRETRTCETALEKTFLVIAMEWEAPYDVDLYVKDPAGNEFSFVKDNRNGDDFPGSNGELSIDMRFGPGIEIWQASPARPGTYDVSYSVIGLPEGETIQVKGWIIDRSGGRRPWPAQRMIGRGRGSVDAVKVQIDDRGFALIEAPAL